MQCYLEMLVEISSIDVLSSHFFKRTQDNMAPGWLHPALLKAKIDTLHHAKLEMKRDNTCTSSTHKHQPQSKAITVKKCLKSQARASETL